MEPVSPSLSGRTAPYRPTRSQDVDLDLVSNSGSKNEIATRISPPQVQQSWVAQRKSAPTARLAANHNVDPALSSSAGSSERAQTVNADTSVRRKSIRNVVRKMFGRRVKQNDVPRQNPSRHGYHKSDPGTLLQVQENQPRPMQYFSAPTSPKRVVSVPVPVHLNDQASLRRIRSPNAVEFPQSARLKPLQLDGPFYQPQSSGLNRRASLPSFIMVDKAQTTTSNNTPDHTGGEIPPLPPLSDTVGSDIGVAVTSANNSRRRSRSADDLNISEKNNRHVRDRAGEIEYWRESYNGSVLRNSFLDHGVSPIEHQTQPTKDNQDNQDCETSTGHRPRQSFTFRPVSRSENDEKRSPAHDSPVFSRPVTAPGNHEMDISDRVNNLEQELNIFRAEIERLTTQNKRHSTLTDSTPRQTGRRNSPSMLLDDLHQRELDDQYRSTDTPPARTFTALYNILSDERSARRELESQVRDLAQDLAEVKYQLSRPIITRESPIYMPRPQRQLHHSQIYNSQHRYTHDSTTVYDAHGNPLTSRFSGSTEASRRESQRREYAPDQLRENGINMDEEDEELQTPHEMYQTPMTEPGAPSGWPKRGTMLSDDGMF